MRVSDLIARTVTQRRPLVWCGVGAVVLVCLTILITRMQLDSDVLNMLPARFRSVQGLRIYDRDFEQARELTFALLCQPQDVDQLEGFAELFEIGRAHV